MTHLPALYKLKLGGVEVLTLCGQAMQQYDEIVFFVHQAPTYCSSCVNRWFEAKKEEARLYENFLAEEARAQAAYEQQMKDAAVAEAARRLDGSFT